MPTDIYRSLVWIGGQKKTVAQSHRHFVTKFKAVTVNFSYTHTHYTRTITLRHSYFTQTWWTHTHMQHVFYTNTLPQMLISTFIFTTLHTHTSFESETNTVAVCWVQWNSTNAKKITCHFYTIRTTIHRWIWKLYLCESELMNSLNEYINKWT